MLLFSKTLKSKRHIHTERLATKVQKQIWKEMKKLTKVMSCQSFMPSPQCMDPSGPRCHLHRSYPTGLLQLDPCNYFPNLQSEWTYFFYAIHLLHVGLGLTKFEIHFYVSRVFPEFVSENGLKPTKGRFCE